MPKDHPLFDPVNLATIDTVRNIELSQTLNSKYLEYPVSSGSEINSTNMLWFALFFVGLVVLSFVFAFSFYKWKSGAIAENLRSAVARERSNQHKPNLQKVREDASAVRASDMVHLSSSDLVHGIALELQDVKKLVCDILLKQDREANAAAVGRKVASAATVIKTSIKGRSLDKAPAAKTKTTYPPVRNRGRAPSAERYSQESFASVVKVDEM